MPPQKGNHQTHPTVARQRTTQKGRPHKRPVRTPPLTPVTRNQMNDAPPPPPMMMGIS